MRLLRCESWSEDAHGNEKHASHLVRFFRCLHVPDSSLSASPIEHNPPSPPPPTSSRMNALLLLLLDHDRNFIDIDSYCQICTGDWNSNTAGYVTTYSQTELFSLCTFGPLNSFRHPARTIVIPNLKPKSGNQERRCIWLTNKATGLKAVCEFTRTQLYGRCDSPHYGNVHLHEPLAQEAYPFVQLRREKQCAANSKFLFQGKNTMINRARSQTLTLRSEFRY